MKTFEFLLRVSNKERQVTIHVSDESEIDDALEKLKEEYPCATDIVCMNKELDGL